MTEPLVHMKKAKDHLRVNHEEFDADIYVKTVQASAIVLKHLKLEDPPDDWFIEESPPLSPPVYDIPADIEAAVLLVLGELWAKREAGVAQILKEADKNLLVGHRTPTMA